MLGRSLLAYVPVNLANIVTSFGTIVVLTRLLAPEEFGRYAIAMITLQFVHMGVFTWIEAAMARFQARAERENDVASHLKTLFQLAIVAGLCLLAIIIPAVLFAPLSDDIRLVLMVALGSASLQVFFNLGMEAHRAAHRIKRYSLTYSAQTLISFSIGIALVMLTPLREAAPFVGIIAGLIIVGTLDLLFMMGRMRGGRFHTKKAKTYFTYGVPICVSLLLSYALNSADVYLIAGLMGEAPAGQYNAGYNLANRSLEILFIWVSMAVTPIAITAMEESGQERSREVMRNYGATLLWIAVPAATGIALVSQDAGFILGESVRTEAVTVMPWIAFAGLINGIMTYYVQRAFMLSGKTGGFVWALVPPVVLNVGLNLVLIPRFGLLGAVWATIASYVIALGLSILIARRHYPLPLPWKALVQIGTASAAMVGAVLLLPDMTVGPLALLVKAATGVCVYGLVCWSLNAADCRTVIRNIITRQRSEPLPGIAE